MTPEQRCVRFRQVLAALLFGIGVCCLAGGASSHELDSAALSLTELTNGRFRVDWRTSSAALREDLAAPAVFPEPCRLEGAFLDCGSRGLSGAIEFPWLAGTRTRVIVDVTWKNGGHLLRVVTADAPTLSVYGIPASAGLRSLEPILADYTRFGIEHILTGLDHLFFVVALTLLVRSTAALVWTITAFTLAHSLSLVSSVLGFVALPAPPVEAAIALSIVLVCAEGLRPRESLARRAPGVVAFAFGLLHGFGFASALLAMGLPDEHVPSALFSFNLGVELGQLGVVAAAGGLRLLAGRLRLSETWWRRGTLYVMGCVAAAWFCDRLGAVFGVT
jgi:hydrogenase/urease accessory protein HupE